MNLDRTFCVSPTHKPDCDRQITPEVKDAMKRCGKLAYSVAHFCGEPEKTEQECENDKAFGNPHFTPITAVASQQGVRPVQEGDCRYSARPGAKRKPELARQE